MKEANMASDAKDGVRVVGEKVTLADPGAVAAEAAARIARLLEGAGGAGDASIALSGGNTPRDTYARLAHDRAVPWPRVRVFWVDERAVPPTDDRSNYRWAKATLLDGVAIPPAQVHRMPADRPDLDAAARDYQGALTAGIAGRAAGGVPVLDVVVLGVGDDGHTASLFPGEATVDVRDRFVAAVHAAPGREARMTLTAPVLENARHVFVLAVGAGKRDALRRVWQKDGDLHATPARVLRNCRGSLTWLVDAAAAGD
jgi:6-phosphogluconolactonase